MNICNERAPTSLIIVIIFLSAQLYWISRATADDDQAPTIRSFVLRNIPSTPSVMDISDSEWATANSLALDRDIVHEAPSSELTRINILTDTHRLFFRFDAKQREPLKAEQRTNNIGDGTDDEITVEIWPTGSAGFHYSFRANPLGTQYQYSSENSQYQPAWECIGSSTNGGYRVMLGIPLDIIHVSSDTTTWRVQFTRLIASTGERQVWSYGLNQTVFDDISYSGTMSGLPKTKVKRLPRIGIYGLASHGSPGSGLSTSRMGADVSVPVSGSSAFFATLHPDYSNVEIDQQTIAPTAFARVYAEYRPFFTQGASFYNAFDCDVCATYVQELYTPNIPTPRDGFAFEGKEGQLSLAAFDALGYERGDGAAAATYTSTDSKAMFTAQNVVANVNGTTDHTTTLGASYGDKMHFDIFANYGTDRGTAVLDNSQAQRYDAGGIYYTSTFAAGGSYRSLGADYNPIDGYVQHPDINGYALLLNKLLLFNNTSFLNSIELGGTLDRYRNHLGQADQSDNMFLADVLTRSLIHLQVTLGSNYLRTPDDIYTPVSQNGVALIYNSGTINDPTQPGVRGFSANPTFIYYNTGRFGPGRVVAWTRSTTFKVGNHLRLSLEADNTNDFLDTGGSRIQWLDRANLTYSVDSRTSLSAGVRKIIGPGPLVSLAPQTPDSTGSNISLAFHRQMKQSEIYFAYGDPSQLQTVPQLILKIIYYIGAQKGA